MPEGFFEGLMEMKSLLVQLGAFFRFPCLKTADPPPLRELLGKPLEPDIGAAMLSYPLDTVRRRMMMQSGKAAEGPSPHGPTPPPPPHPEGGSDERGSGGKTRTRGHTCPPPRHLSASDQDQNSIRFADTYQAAGGGGERKWKSRVFVSGWTGSRVCASAGMWRDPKILQWG